MEHTVVPRGAMPLPTLIEQAKAYLQPLQYNAYTVGKYHLVWRRLEQFAQTDPEGAVFSEALGHRFLQTVYDFPPAAYPCPLPNRVRLARRAVRCVGDLVLHGQFRRRCPKSLPAPWPAQYQMEMAAFFDDCVRRGLSVRGRRGREREMRKFAEFLDSLGLSTCAAIHPSHITAYVSTLFQYQQKTVEMTLCHLRGFFRFLYLHGQHTHDLSNAVPRIRCTVQPHIPSVWTREEVERLLSVVDRGNPCGKRDYAMLLLVARLGVRVGDLRDLRLYHLDWEAKRIVLPQAKTGQVVSLPLLEDVGWALIEYLQTGRPPVTSPYVFVRHHAPFEPFGLDNNLSHVIAKYMRLARIPIPAGKKHGLHSLRHTLASALLEQHTPLPTIAEILGHLDARTTSIYLKVDIAQLRQCALDPEEVSHATV